MPVPLKLNVWTNYFFFVTPVPGKNSIHTLISNWPDDVLPSKAKGAYNILIGGFLWRYL